MKQYSVAHLLMAMLIASLFAALAQFGEMGVSLMPVLFFLGLCFVPVVLKLELCPDVLKFRFHIGIAMFMACIYSQGFTFIFGWWRLPFNVVVSFLIIPAILLLTQFAKHQSNVASCVELRAIQISAVWFVVVMLATSSYFGTIGI